MILELRGLSKRLGARPIWAGVELRCGPAQVVMISGDNGSGKTTLLRSIAGIIEADSGEVLICGRSLAREPRLAKAHLGYVPDNLDVVPELLVSELLGLVAALKSHARRARAAPDPRWQSRLGVDALRGQRLRSLSFGQRKRVALLAALIGEPELLILDEPSNGLDPAGVQLLLALIDERRAAARATLLTSHDPELSSQLCATRYRLVSGQLAPG